MTIISTAVGKNPLEKNRVALIVNNRVWNAVLGYNLKNDRIILVCFQGKPFNITISQVYAPNTDAKEAEINPSFEDLQDLELSHTHKNVFFITGDWNAKVGSQEMPDIQASLALEYKMKQVKG